MSGTFANSEESFPGYEEVQAAFDYLCAAQGELAAVTGEAWHAIAGIKPAYMCTEKALEKKKEAVMIATMAYKLRQEEAAARKARERAEEIAKSNRVRVRRSTQNCRTDRTREC